MPVVWTRLNKNDNGTTNKILTTTMGSATDLENEGLRRLVVNGVYWGLGMDVPAKADVTYVDEYIPSFYGFDGFRKGLRASDFELGKKVPGQPLPRPGRFGHPAGPLRLFYRIIPLRLLAKRLREHEEAILALGKMRFDRGPLSRCRPAVDIAREQIGVEASGAVVVVSLERCLNHDGLRQATTVPSPVLARHASVSRRGAPG